MMKTVVGVDPGYERSAVVMFADGKIREHHRLANEDMLKFLMLARQENTTLVLERVASFGMPVGEEIFETVFWTGRFAQAWGREFHRVTRHQVKLALCKNARANDTHIRQVLIDKFGPGREVAIGSKAHPGPLYGISADQWSALAVAVTWVDSQGGRE